MAEVCVHCGKPAYKTDGNASPICEGMAFFGDCEYNFIMKPYILPEPENQTPKKWQGGVSVQVGSEKKQGRNELCNCGSGKKAKRCCQ